MEGAEMNSEGIPGHDYPTGEAVDVWEDWWEVEE